MYLQLGIHTFGMYIQWDIHTFGMYLKLDINTYDMYMRFIHSDCVQVFLYNEIFYIKIHIFFILYEKILDFNYKNDF